MKVLYCVHADTVSSAILGCYGYFFKKIVTLMHPFMRGYKKKLLTLKINIFLQFFLITILTPVHFITLSPACYRFITTNNYMSVRT